MRVNLRLVVIDGMWPIRIEHFIPYLLLPAKQSAGTKVKLLYFVFYSI